ncbi:putative inactive phenolphthiocerol synthesis polyketide synthase type I Pks15 [Nocardia sp. RB56]|uniref:Putative inactive phenolphthiocerol synthesis polyketide synthase type I Pks15 n=2 Tax=Nocardia aurantia TaxID=2585199 RepID=A0A7K0DJG5_9NOCA|nr:putative inactive phenolphthiocerol synthesis polyketide synthase type I Pks15 [Nocardia aurantia]
MMRTSIPDDPIVVVGMGVEAPGDIETLPELWSVLIESRETIGPFPRDREWPLGRLLGLGDRSGWGVVQDAGGFLTGATEFDPLFFGISPREAAAMDPQQRVAMRVAWRALEHAGLNPAALDGDSAGCWMGVSPLEYGPLMAVASESSGYRLSGTALGSVAGRISHAIGLAGPSISVDTSCASALTAIHQAAAALRAGECDWALAGGVCVMGAPGPFYDFAKNNALSSDGHCRPYADETTGTLWGEAAGMVVLEHRSRAERSGHVIYGQLLGSRVNHNGKGAPIAVPRADAQHRLIDDTLAAAGIDPALIGLIEGHGTGTAVGDPVELSALIGTYGSAAGQPRLGSVKSNIGHTQAAAGVLGLLKMLLCGAHGTIAPSLWADTPTTAVDWSATGLRLAAAVEPWEAIDGIRYGAVSAFGIGGTNAHLIVGMPELEEEYV